MWIELWKNTNNSDGVLVVETDHCTFKISLSWYGSENTVELNQTEAKDLYETLGRSLRQKGVIKNAFCGCPCEGCEECEYEP